MDIEEDYYDFENCFDRYFNNGVLFLKAGYVGDTLNEDNIIKIPFKILKKDLPIELARYVKNYVVEASRWKGIYNAWYIKVLKGHTRAVKRL